MGCIDFYTQWQSVHKFKFKYILTLIAVMAKCPNCKEIINLSQLKTEEFEDGDLLFKFLGLSCPNCEVLLKIQKID